MWWAVAWGGVDEAGLVGAVQIGVLKVLSAHPGVHAAVEAIKRDRNAGVAGLIVRITGSLADHEAGRTILARLESNEAIAAP